MVVFFSLAFYLGAVGVVATLAAILWRTFDNPLFRDLYFNTLGLGAGNELLIAFIPAIVFGSVAVGVDAAVSTYRFFLGFRTKKAADRHARLRTASLLIFVFAFLTSIAIFLGNGLTSTRSNSDGGDLYLNHYAQALAVLAGIIQVLVFLGRDRLFRSEQGEMKPWQRHMQQGITSVVLMLLIFIMVHLMGREDISHYTRNRDPQFVLGDVSNASTMESVFDNFMGETQTDSDTVAEAALNVPESVKTQMEYMKPKGKWNQTLAAWRLGGLDIVRKEDLSDPPYPNADVEFQKLWSLPKRIYGAGIAYYLAMKAIPPLYKADRVGADAVSDANEKQAASDAGGDENASCFTVVKSAFRQALHSRATRRGQLEKWNGELGKESFTRYLLTCVLQDGEWDPSGPSDFDETATLTALRTLLDKTAAKLTPEQKTELVGAVRALGLKQAATSPIAQTTEAVNESSVIAANGGSNTEEDGSSTGPQDAKGEINDRTEVEAPVVATSTVDTDTKTRTAPATATSPASNQLPDPSSVAGEVKSRAVSGNGPNAAVNRTLLEALLPGAIRAHRIPSTWVVPLHDQRTRKRWLGLWLCLLLVGMIGGMGPHRVATVFNFYRKQLGSNFLVAPQYDDSATADGTVDRTKSKGLGKRWSRRCASKELHQLHPTGDGLPYPLMLAASLEPATRNGSYHVEARPFVFSPLYCGRFYENEEPIPSKQLSFALNPLGPAVTLGDAVTLSGAAVTPLMTQNRWLSIILDFFNTGIGQRMRRVDRTDSRLRRQSLLPWTQSILSCVLVLLASLVLLHLGWAMTSLAVVNMAVFALCVAMRIGSPGLIRSLVYPRTGQSYETGREHDEERSFYLADGGYCDYLGVSELLRRRCELIIVSDAGANIGTDPLGTLARMCENASQESGIRFLDLDHEAPIDFGRLQINDQRLVHQPYLCMRIRYPEPDRKEGLMFYCQMSITDGDPIEIRHIRNLFPSFPDEPTVNQFYTEKQVTAYRSLGYHIANRLCNELETWKVRTPEAGKSVDPASSQMNTLPAAMASTRTRRFADALLMGHKNAALAAKPRRELRQWTHQPLFDVLKDRLLTAYRLACYEEHSYRRDDIFSEAIWPTKTFAFPTFRRTVQRVAFSEKNRSGLRNRWLRAYEGSADVRSAYRTAVIGDINSLDLGVECNCATLWSVIAQIAEIHQAVDGAPALNWLAAHLTNIATACQEIHRGRPHAAFQVGGREKLIQLCGSIAEAIRGTFAAQSKGQDGQHLLADMNLVMAELIEMKGSVFQGGEHITLISFAQCIGAMWGRIVRAEHHPVNDDTVQGMLNVFLGPEELTPSEASTEARTPELRVVELRSDLDKGLKELRLNFVCRALAKSWYLGYFTNDELKEQLDQKTRTVSSDKPVGKKTTTRRSSKTASHPKKTK